MWRDVQLKHEKVSYQLYFQVFESENIGFLRPNQDECDICAKFNAYKGQEKHSDPCDACEKENEHLHKAKEARDECRI